MSTTTARAISAGDAGNAARPAWRSHLGHPGVRMGTAILGSLALVVAGMLPVWGTRLQAPQYPKGLSLWFYGGRVEGPVREVNGLNHYIGMRPIDLALVPEMALWPLAVVAGAVLLVAAVSWRGWAGRLALLGLWLIPVVVLIDIQRWLVVFATSLDGTAALRVGSFVPLVVGPTQVWNFTVLSYPGPALILFWVVALAATLARRARPIEGRARLLTAIASIGLAVAGTVLLVLPAAASAASPTVGHDHGATSRPSGTTDDADDAGDLQAMLAAAPDGATVAVPPGAYQANLVISRPVTLVADGHVLIDGGGRGSVVTITADDVTLRGFHVMSSGGQVQEGAAVKVIDASRVGIEGNTIERFFTGIATLGSSDVRIEGNHIQGAGRVELDAGHALADDASPSEPGSIGGATPAPQGHAGHEGTAAPDGGQGVAGHADGPRGQGDGISLWDSTAVTIVGNTVRDVRDGLYLSYADAVLVDTNEIASSRYALHSMFGSQLTVFGNRLTDNLAGLVLMYSTDVLVGRNAILDHRSAGTGVGVAIKDVSGIRVAENVILGNRVGLHAEGTMRTASTEAAVLRNRFASNGVAVALMASADLGFAANSFRDNLTDVHAVDQNVARRNDWTYQGTGNHWAAYGGYDLDGDSVGDLPHSASGSLDVLVAAAPAVAALTTSPAFHALSFAQGLWESDREVALVDHAPRIDDPAPTLADLGFAMGTDGALADDGRGWLLLGIFLGLLTLTGVKLAAIRAAGREAR